jgi:Flp pilus assembly protein TadG
MSENNHMASSMPRRRRSQVGAFAVEFALVILAYFTLVFCVIEVARLVYVWNTLQEVTRRAATAAANTDFTNVSANNLVRQQAIFRNSAGTLAAGSPVTDAHVRIDYMSLARASDGSMTLTAMPSGSIPSSPARNQVACTADPNSAGCIRFVRVRICTPGTDPTVCDPVQYVPLLPLITVSALTLPMSTTIASAETLGYEPGQPLGP